VDSGTIGTTAGNQAQSVTLHAASGNNDYLEITDSRISNGSDWTSAGWRIQQKIDATWMAYIQFNGGNNYGMSFGTGGGSTSPFDATEKMRITSGGYVGINNASPSVALDVTGYGKFSNSMTAQNVYAVSDSSEQMVISTASDTNKQLIFGRTATEAKIIAVTQGVGYVPLCLNPNGGNVSVNYTTNSYALDVSGDIRATGDVIAYSDARVKDNVLTIENALDKVKSLRGVSYTRNDSEDKSTKIGVIAQEVLSILPEVVQQDDNGNYSVAYGNIVGVLIEAIKEQQKQIDELKNIISNK